MTDAPAMIRIGLFGSLRITVDGAPYRFAAPPKTLPLLAYLLINRERAVAREALAFALWHDESEDVARANLRRHLHYLAGALPGCGSRWTQSDKRYVQWNAALPLTLDVAEFERLVRAPDAAARRGATTVYAGDLLEDLEEEWLPYERDRLRGLHVANLEGLLAQSLHDGDDVATADDARRLLAFDPWREDALRALVSARARSGDRAGAAAEYHRFADRLKRELGVDPMPETVACSRAITTRSNEAPVPDSVPEPAAGAAFAFVGRARELAALRTRWAAATATPGGGLVLVGGEAGIGKSRLYCEFGSAIAATGARMLVGRTIAGEPAPYGPLLEALRAAGIDRAPLEPIWRGLLARLVPELYGPAAAEFAEPPALDDGAIRTRYFEAIARGFSAAASGTPLLIVLEDLHWADETTIACLEFLTRRLRGQPILLAATYREEDLSPEHALRRLRRATVRDPNVAHLALGPLDAAAVTSLVATVPALAPRAPALAVQLHAESEGNAFFLSELLAEALVSGTPGYGMTAPGREAIFERLDRLSSPARTAAEIAAVIGREFDVEFFASVSGWSEGEALAALDELLDRRIVRDAGSRNEYHLAFTHQLMQSAVYARCTQSSLRRRHRRVAVALQRRHAGSGDEAAAEIARHFDRADDPAAAAPLYLRAAAAALAIAATDAAASYARRACELAQTPQFAFDALAVHEEAARRRLDRQGQRDDLAAMIALGSGDLATDADRIFEALVRSVAFFRAVEERQAEVEALDELERLALESGQPRHLAVARHARASFLVASHAEEAADPYFLEAAACFARARQPGGEAATWIDLAESYGRRLKFEAAHAALEHATRYSTGTGDESLRMRLTRVQMMLAFLSEQRQELHRLAGVLEALAERFGDRECLAYAYSHRGAAAARLFAIAEARDYLQRADELFAEAGNVRGRVQHLQKVVFAEQYFGDRGRAVERAREADALAREIPQAFHQAVAAMNFAQALNYAERHAEALEPARRSVAAARRASLEHICGTALCNLGTAEAGVGRVRDGIEHLREGTDVHRRFGRTNMLAEDLPVLTEAQLEAGDVDGAAATAREFRALYAGGAARMIVPQLGLWVAAQVARRLDEPHDARELLAAAYRELAARAEQLSDTGARDAFRALRTHRELLAAHEHDRWPQRAQPARRPAALLPSRAW